MTVDRIYERVRKYADHELIRRYAELPGFPETRAKLIFAFLRHSSVPLPLGELVTLVTSLMQMALDIHDRVKDADGEGTDPSAVRIRQLNVLAGDYLSGRFYHLLSQAGEIELTRRLAEAICEVNRIKAAFYVRMKQFLLTPEEYLQLASSIRSRLFVEVSRWKEGVFKRIGPELLEMLCKCEVLIGEWVDGARSDRGRDRWAFWHLFQIGSAEDRRHLCEEKLDAERWEAMTRKYGVRQQLGRLLAYHVRQLAESLSRLDKPLAQELVPALAPVLKFNGL
ncbi:MAG: hypothetical protein BLM47_00880 [Candidatus Reconcilbacillus cellulovorans]|uniref:Heptaprenyl diphosphate synthase n=1 Tax=Candidatus Reconcilbacillus cellulovorans TaxID=1906605 RepID=A0A2A6E3T4_9BACL|nr:MAG: hypothetical protein BLM47_00880 [Candidatus Reconcilbacillus cellulovorans]